MHILVVYNPVAGFAFKLENAKNVIQRYLDKRDIKYTWLETDKETNQHIVDELHKNYERILVCGGDGTVREIANELIRLKSPTPLAIMPLGTMNVMALSLNIPLTIRRALHYALYKPSTSLDVGLVNNKRHFFIACGVGYDAEIMHGTKRYIKRWLGPFSYWIVAFAKSWRNQPIKGTLTTDYGSENISISTLISFNVKTLIARHPLIRRQPHAGKLDILIADYISVGNVLRLLWYIVWDKPRDTPPLRLFTTSQLTFTADEPFQYEIDGDVFQDTSVTITLVPNALNIICPPQNKR